MVVRLSVLVPANGHLPLVLGSIVGADQNVCDLDRRTGVYLLQKFVYTAHDFADVEVALSQSLIPWGDRNPENRDYDHVWVQIDGERVKEGVSVCGLDVVKFAVVGRHITELVVGEVDTRDNPGAGAQRRRGVRGRGRGICGEGGRIRRTLAVHANRLRYGSWLPAAGEQAMDDRLKKPSRQIKAVWEFVEEPIQLPKAFVLLQLHRFHNFPRDSNGFEVDCPTIGADQICRWAREHCDHLIRDVGNESTVYGER